MQRPDIEHYKRRVKTAEKLPAGASFNLQIISNLIEYIEYLESNRDFIKQKLNHALKILGEN